MNVSPFAVIFKAAFAAPALVVALSAACLAQAGGRGNVTEFAIAYPDKAHASAPHANPTLHGTAAAHAGSTHEITFDERRGGDLWITGQNYDALVRVTADGRMSFRKMPEGSGPHGIEFDAEGLLWVTLEFHGRVVAFDREGKLVRDHDVRLDCTTCPDKINTHPHGLGVAADGKTVWFTGKGTGTVGKITPDGKVHTYALPTVGSVPIYIRSGPDGNMWVTELVGNKIARVTPDGRVTEFAIPTFNSRPIAIVPGPDGRMWFTEEAGNKVGRVERDGRITEFAVPKAQANVILAGLAFDREGNLWVQQYVDHNNPAPAGRDHIVKIDKAILTAEPSVLPRRHFTFYPVPTRDTVMHRIIQGPDGHLWFTEMHADKVGRLAPGRARP
jgi:virginiamycin B lyase